MRKMKSHALQHFSHHVQLLQIMCTTTIWRADSFGTTSEYYNPDAENSVYYSDSDSEGTEEDEVRN